MEEDTPPLDEMRLLAEERQGDNSGVLSVSEISAALKRHVEQGFSHVRIRGEISGFKRAASGHLYLSLKDENARIDGVMWKGNAGRLAFVPQDGVEVIASGKLTTYPGRSNYQIVIDTMEVAGEGALLALLEKLKAKLAAEGLFDPARKRALPFLPRTIGVVTSPTGAVIRDILHRLADRCPTRVIVWPVLVQGQGSAEQVAAAVSSFSAMQGADRPDLVIVARGGGSIEDLWGFNEEIVVRAVAASTIPIISAVGHETDTTLCDFAADIRAPTPTAAAELAVPVRAELLAGLQSAQARALRAVRRYAERADERLVETARRLPSLDTLLGPQRQKVDDFGDRLRRGLSHRLSDARGELARVSGALRPVMLTQKLANAEQRLTQTWRLAESLHPLRPLERGYVLVKDRQGGVVSDAARANRAKLLILTFSDGEVPVRVEPEARPAYNAQKPEQPSLL
jgi:exodeoxyribonuclease VII large subunit